MNIETERAKNIQHYIDNHPEAKAGVRTILISGKREPITAYNLPIKLLSYSVENGRFAVEKILIEKELGRELNYDDDDDIARIHQLLTQDDSGNLSEKTKLLIEDLKRFEQEEDGVITHDGFVINGNRRMAALQELHKLDPTGKWLFLRVQRLPPSIEPADLWRIEAGLQLSKEKREKYGPMNELLKVREGIEAELTEDEIASTLYEWDKKDVEDAIERLKVIDNFLEHVGQTEKGGYGFIQKYDLHEKFISFQKICQSRQFKAFSAKEKDKRIKGAFEAIYASALLSKKTGQKGEQLTNDDIRTLGKIFQDDDALELFLKPLHGGKHTRDNKPEIIRDALKDAQEQLNFKNDNKRPQRLIERATRAIKSIDRKNPALHSDSVKETFAELESEIKKLKRDLGL